MNKAAPAQNRTWMVLHAVLALGLPLFLALVASCIKAPELKQGDLGPEASDNDLERVISKALYGIDPWKSAIGQQVVYDFNARIENQEQVRPIVRLTQTIRDRKDERIGNRLKLTLHVQNHELDLNNGEVERYEPEPMEYYVDAATNSLTLRDLSRPFDTQNLDKWIYEGWLTQVVKFFALNDFKSPQIQNERPVKRVSYHNLAEESGVMAPPESVMNRPNCGNVPGCQLRYMRIAYDEALWYTDSEYELRKWHFVISRDAPFIGYIYERCLASMVRGEGRRYYVRQCQFTRDFSYEGASAP